MRSCVLYDTAVNIQICFPWHHLTVSPYGTWCTATMEAFFFCKPLKRKNNFLWTLHDSTGCMKDCFLRMRARARVYGASSEEGNRSLKLLSVQISVFTGANGVCLHYATTVQCRLVVVRLIFYLLNWQKTERRARTQTCNKRCYKY